MLIRDISHHGRMMRLLAERKFRKININTKNKRVAWFWLKISCLISCLKNIFSRVSDLHKKKQPIRCVKAFTPHFLHRGTPWCYNNSHIFLPVWQLCQQDVDGLCKYLYLQTCFSFSHHENCLQGLYCGGRALHTAALSCTSEQLITRLSFP